MAIIVAGGGYGKSVVAAEHTRALGAAGATIRLEQGDDGAEMLAGRLRRGLHRSGLSDASAAIEGAAVTASQAVEGLLDYLSGTDDPVVLVVDDVEQAGTTTAGALALLARDWPLPHRLVLSGRELPTPMEGLHAEPDTVLVGAADLAFDVAETATLLRALGAGSLVRSDVEALVRATGGWAAALVIAANLVAHAHAPLDASALGESAFASQVEELLDRLDRAPAKAVVQLAHLPALPLADLAEVTGVSGLVNTARAAGFPLEVRSDGHVDLVGPVRDVLRSRAPVDRDVARRAAGSLIATGEALEAIRLLLGAGDSDGAARELAALPTSIASTFDYGELRALLEVIGPAADRHPGALLHFARACEAAAEARVRTDVLDRARSAASGDPALEREIDAERARDLARDGDADEAAALAERLLAEADSDELQTRVRALHVLGRTQAWRGDPAALAAAEPLLEEAAELYLRLGYPTGSAHARLGLAYDVYTLGARFDDAVAQLEQALAVLPRRSRLRGIVLAFHAEALVDLGRYQDAEASHAEAERIGRQFGDARTVAFTAWVRARVAARRGDGDRVRALLAEAERSKGDWFDHHSGVEFLAEAAVLLDEVGDTVEADAYLARAQARWNEAPRYVLLAEGAIAARRGDPAEAERLLAAVAERPDLETRERWRVALLRAWAARRAENEEQAASHAHDALELATATGHPELPFVREPTLAPALLGFTTERLTSGSPIVSLLGELSVVRAGDRVPLPPGRPSLLLAFVAVNGGRVQVDEAIEALWPEVEPASGRKRLRNVLSRLRATAGALVVREGDMLTLGPATEVDAIAFERDAVAALAATEPRVAAARARATFAHYAELLPDHRYVDWTAEPRERLHARALALVDLLASRSEAEGDVDDAIRLLEQGIELDRLDESRYLRAARLLLAQGRRGRALETLRRSAAALHRIGLEPSDEHRALVRAARA